MLDGFANASRIPELRKRLGFTAGALAIYRLGVAIPTPGIDGQALAQFFEQARNNVVGLVNLFSGGALERFSIFALGIMPYISASIILQLLTVVVPYLEKLSKQGVQQLQSTTATPKSIASGERTIDARRGGDDGDSKLRSGTGFGIEGSREGGGAFSGAGLSSAGAGTGLSGSSTRATSRDTLRRCNARMLSTMISPVRPKIRNTASMRLHHDCTSSASSHTFASPYTPMKTTVHWASGYQSS